MTRGNPATLIDKGWPAQEPRCAPYGMIASVNPLASAAGLRVLRDGGNAMDAAIAAGAVLTVVEPWSGQLGGDLFLLVASAEGGTVTAINGSGAAPHRATIDRYLALGQIPESGWLAASVPGIVDAWQVAAQRFGTRPLGALLEDAISYAEAGFPLTARQARNNAQMATIAAEFPDTMAVFFPNGRPPAAGFRLKQPDLARTLRTIQAEGASAFYRGSIAERIVAASDRGGGLFSERDLAQHRTDVLDPIQTTYRGWTVLEQPPVSQGLIVLIALNILDGVDLPADPADRVHLQVEAHKLALKERLSHVGDPVFSPIAIDQLLSRERGQALARRIDQRRAGALQPETAGHPDTTYLCVVDEARNVVSYIHSLYAGNGVVAGDTGILLNNRMGCFSLDENSPNRLAPGKRPIHTLNSWMLLQNGTPRVVGGTPGSFWQVQTNLQLIQNLIDLGMPVQAAIDAPRWTMGGQTSWTDASLSLEGRFGEAVNRSLTERGHTVHSIGDWAAGGAAQVIGIEDGMLSGGGDPRPGTSSVIGY
jgi:gamma-glutamyltranspeptidase/glutathione hydrolase